MTQTLMVTLSARSEGPSVGALAQPTTERALTISGTPNDVQAALANLPAEVLRAHLGVSAPESFASATGGLHETGRRTPLFVNGVPIQTTPAATGAFVEIVRHSEFAGQGMSRTVTIAGTAQEVGAAEAAMFRAESQSSAPTPQ